MRTKPENCEVSTVRPAPANARLRALVLGVIIATSTTFDPTRASAQAPKQYLPLPAQAMPLPTANGYRLDRVGANSYVVSAGGEQSVFVVTSAGVVLIDAPPSLKDALPAAIKSVTAKPVTHVILSHSHYDHIGGVTQFRGAKLIAHALTAQLLKVYPDPARPIPTLTFAGDSQLITIGGQRFQLLYPGPNHEIGNIIVYVPNDKLVVMMDLAMPGWAPYLNWGNADYIPGMFKAYDAVLGLDFDSYVGGHVYRVGTREDVELSRAYMIDLWKWTNEEMAAVPFKPDPNLWGTINNWLDQIADRVTQRLVGKWKDRIAAVDAFTHSTVAAAVVCIQTDAPKIPPELLK